MPTTRQMQGHLARYVHHVDHGVLSIIDHGRGRSVTNDIEQVLAEVAEHGVDLNSVQVMYRDTRGAWDAVQIESGHFSALVPLNETDENRARSRLKALKGKPS